MVGHKPEIDGSKPVCGAHQVELLVYCQIAQVQRAESAESDMTAHRLRVFRRIRISRLERGAVRIRSACTRQVGRDRLSCGLNNPPFQP
jgi:hypothetical protein